jgi:ribosome-associated protein
MPDDAWLTVGNSLRIPRSELSFRATRAGGPGGQHVNTSSTRIELWWHLPSSAALTEGQRESLAERLAHRLDSEGWLRLVEAGSRSQLRNRESVTARFVALLRQALRPRKLRKPTRVPPGQKRKRLEAKRQRAEVKRLRGRVRGDD